MTVEMGLNIQWLPEERTAEQVTTIARTAEAAGFGSMWVSEHIVIPHRISTRDPYDPQGRLPFDPDTNYPEAMVLLGFLAAATTTLRLGTYVVPAITRDPLSLAKQAATVDVLSGGRLELGLGAGYLREEAQALGRPYDDRAGRLAETIDIAFKAWTEWSFTHQGDHWDIPEVSVRPFPLQGAQLPVWIGGSGPRALRTAASRGSGILTPKATPKLVAQIRGALPATCRVSAGLHLAWDPAADTAMARDLVNAGADLLIVHSGADEETVKRGIDYVATQVVPRL